MLPVARIQLQIGGGKIQAAGLGQRLVTFDPLTGFAAVNLFTVLAFAGVTGFRFAVVDQVGVDEQLPQATQGRAELGRQGAATQHLLVIQL